MWTIEFSQEANNYAIDSLPYNEDVLIAIERLAFQASGLPAEGTYYPIDELLIWEVAGHTVIYERGDDALYIWTIKPAE